MYIDVYTTCIQLLLLLVKQALDIFSILGSSYPILSAIYMVIYIRFTFGECVLAAGTNVE